MPCGTWGRDSKTASRGPGPDRATLRLYLRLRDAYLPRRQIRTKLLGVEAGATDQRAVDVGLLHDRGDVVVP